MDFTGITITGGFNALPTTNVPDAPTIGTATATGANSATVAFTAPASNGNSTIISYTAISTPGNITGTLVQSDSGTITVNGLVPSTSYTFTVYATNSIGSGSLSSASNSITTSAPAINPYSWGTNQYYQLALSDTVPRSSPTQIGSTGDWSTLAVGYRYTLATKNNGTLWAVGGRADNGGFGLGSGVGYVSSPIQVGALTTWNNVGVGYYTSTAIKTDGTLWSWGQFGSGPLNGASIGLLFGVSSPVLIGSDTDWVDIFQTQSFGLGIKTDNSLWAWGDNTYGQLGTNSPIGANSPIQVGNDTDWVNIGGGAYNALATRTNGTLWSWGNNSNGELGINSVILRSSPVQIGGLTNWYKIVKSSSGFFTTQTSVFATKTNGTLWGWGNNQFGSVGDNTVINRSSPVQIGTDTNWNNITTAGKVVTTTSTQFTIANRTDGTLWSWGGNQTGELGQNDLVYRSSPVQVGSSTTWVNSVGSGENYVMALNGSKTAPSAPTILAVEAVSSTSVRVSFAAPIVTGTYSYVAYTATSTPGGYTGTLSNKSGGGGIIVNNLIPGTSYTFTVTATNSIGTSAPSSASDSVIPVDTPNPELYLYSVGANQEGQLGINSTINRSSPVQVGQLRSWKTVLSGGPNATQAMSLGLLTDGTLWAWGPNDSGQLGLGDTIYRSAPVQIGNGSDWEAITVSAGIYAAAIKKDGSLWTWGSNAWGQLGLNDQVYRSSPTQIGSNTDWRNLRAGIVNMYIVKTNGTLWVTGYGGPPLGLISTVSRSSPTQIGTDTNWDYVSTGGDDVASSSVFAKKIDGTLWAWGSNSYGQLGLNDVVTRSSPVQIGSETTWVKISRGRYNAAAIKNNGSLWTWGENAFGVLGLNDTVHRSSPTQLGTSSWTVVSAGRTTKAIKTDGTIWSWGPNGVGQLGLGDVVSRSSPVQIGSDTNWLRASSEFTGGTAMLIKGTAAKPSAPTNVVATVTGISTVSVSFTRPLSDNGSDIVQYTVTSTPDNIKAYSTVLGPITVVGLNPQSTYTFTVTATNSVGESLPSSASNSVTTNIPTTELYTWGLNANGQMGTNNIIARSSPVQVGSASTWSTISVGYKHVLATKKDGTLWAWGPNGVGQLGVNDNVTRSSPVQVGSLTNWRVVSATAVSQDAVSLAVKTDGTLWVWGEPISISGISNSNSTNKSSPVQLGSDTNWSSVFSGPYSTFALKTNGTLWAWGDNSAGQLGTNNTIARSSPVQVGADTDWISIGGNTQNVLAIKTNGTLWSWGDNTFGTLGDNTTISRSSPVQVGSLTTWARISKTQSTGSDTNFLIKTDGTLWVCGDSRHGQTGLNSISIERSSPTQIGSDTNWSIVNAGYSSVVGVKSDGTLWSWGSNSGGILGLSNIIPRSSPTQIGSGTNWVNVLPASPARDVVGAIAGTTTAPSAPIILSATLINATTATVDFLAPISNGNSPITTYSITRLPGNVQYPLGIINTVNCIDGGSTVFSDLTLDTTYTFTVTATNSIGTSVPSNSVSVVTSTTIPTTIDYVVVAGGGGGGYGGGGGGGGGGFLTGTGYSITPGVPITVIVGEGGTGSVDSTQPGNNGSNSVFGSITAIGGGGGGSIQSGSAGGSGGGGSSVSGYAAGGAGTIGQGYDGGTGQTVDTGGGGGAGGAGSDSTGTPLDGTGNGGPGLQAFDGKYYGGGGGGAQSNTSTGTGLGGIGGGGQATIFHINTGTILGCSGSPNSGGGGGGGYSGGAPYDGFNGAAGAVVLRYLDSYAPASVTTGTVSTIQRDGYRYYTFTSSGSITFTTSDTPIYVITPLSSSVNEGSALTFNAGGIGIINGTYYWTINSNVGDFETSSGSFTITSNAGSFTVTPTADQLTEGAETFTVSLRIGSVSGDIVATSIPVTINDISLTPTYTITPASSSVNEVSTLTFNVGGTNIINGTYYWSINNISTAANDFSASSGSFTITSNAGSFTVTTTDDATTEGAETFTVSLRTGSTSGTIVATSSTVTINDTSTASLPTQRAIFGYGTSGGDLSITNKVSSTGVVATDTTGVGTARNGLAAAGYGGDKAIFGYGTTVSYSNKALTNLVSNTGVVATDTAGVGTARYNLAAAGYGGNKAIFGYGSTSLIYTAITNKVSSTGVVATDTAGVGTVRQYLAAAGYGGDKAIFGYGFGQSEANYLSMTNLVSNTGVVATDTTGVGTARWGLAAAGYGGNKAIFGFGVIQGGELLYATNLVSNTGVVASDVTFVSYTGPGQTRSARASYAAASYGGDKAIFGYGGGPTSITNLISNTGVMGTDIAGVGTARTGLAAAGYSST